MTQNERILSALLYRAIRELNFIHQTEGVPQRISCLITTAEGKAIVDLGIKVLLVSDLSEEFLVTHP